MDEAAAILRGGHPQARTPNITVDFDFLAFLALSEISHMN